MIGVADVGAEEDLAAGIRVGLQLLGGYANGFGDFFGSSAEFLVFHFKEGECGDEGDTGGLDSLDEVGSPRAAHGSGVGENIDAALQGHFDPFSIRRVGEHGLSGAMGFGDDGVCEVQRHNQNAL